MTVERHAVYVGNSVKSEMSGTLSEPQSAVGEVLPGDCLPGARPLRQDHRGEHPVRGQLQGGPHGGGERNFYTEMCLELVGGGGVDFKTAAC